MRLQRVIALALITLCAAGAMAQRVVVSQVMDDASYNRLRAGLGMALTEILNEADDTHGHVRRFRLAHQVVTKMPEFVDRTAEFLATGVPELYFDLGTGSLHFDAGGSPDDQDPLVTPNQAKQIYLDYWRLFANVPTASPPS